MTMSIVSVPMCKAQAPVNFQRKLSMDPFFQNHRKEKVVVIMGATGSGKSKLAVDLATHFSPAEIVNSDKMQVYKGLDITTNKITEDECLGVNHHLIGIADPNSDFSATDFIHHASSAIDSILSRHRLPIIAGGSNSYIEGLVTQNAAFRFSYKCCFIWVDVSLPVLHSFLSDRVDRMMDAGQVEEVRRMFDPSADYTRGIRRAIGVSELDEFLRTELATADERAKKKLLEDAIAKMKINNCRLANRQLQKIHRLQGLWKRNMHRVDATEAFVKSGEEAEEAWKNQVVTKSRRIVHKFLYEENHASPRAVINAVPPPPPPPPPQVAMVAARR